MKESPLKRFLVASHYRAKGLLCRVVPASRKMLPSFMVIGAQKAGTTAMFDYLISHPQVLEPWFKEMDFFNRRRMFANRSDYGLSQYQALFPLLSLAKSLENRLSKPVITGEASQYMSYPEVPGRIKNFFPEMKFIVLLRDPVERAYSHYSMRKRYGWETASFTEAFHREDIAKGMSETSSYKFRGLYAMHLKWWFSCFPQEDFLIMESNQVRQDKTGAYTQVCEFLGIEPRIPVAEIESNVGGYNRPDTAEFKLWREFYRPYNEQLYQLLDRDFAWD